MQELEGSILIYSQSVPFSNLCGSSKETDLPVPNLIGERAVRQLPDPSGFFSDKKEEYMLRACSEVHSPGILSHQNITDLILT